MTPYEAEICLSVASFLLWTPLGGHPVCVLSLSLRDSRREVMCLNLCSRLSALPSSNHRYGMWFILEFWEGVKIDVCIKPAAFNWRSRLHSLDFPGGPVVKNLPSSAGDVGSIPGRVTKIPRGTEKLSPHTARGSGHCNERSHMTVKTRCAAAKTWYGQINQLIKIKKKKRTPSPIPSERSSLAQAPPDPLRTVKWN